MNESKESNFANHNFSVLAQSFVINPQHDSPADTEIKKSGYCVVIQGRNSIDIIRNSLISWQAGKSGEFARKITKTELLSNFDHLLIACANNLPIVPTLGISNSEIRAALYKGAEERISRAKLAIAEEKTGVTIVGSVAIEKVTPNYISSLEWLQEQLMAPASSSRVEQR